MEALLVVLFVGLAVAGAYHGDRNCRKHIATWAGQNGYDLVSATRAWLTFRFFWRSDEQRVYEVVVRDATGRERVAYAKVGGYFFGSWSDRVDVRWE